MQLPSIRSVTATIIILTVLSISLRQYYQTFWNLSKLPNPFMYKEEWLQEGAGMKIMPPPVQIAKRMIDSLKLPSYRVIGQLQSTDGNYMELMLVESAWPSRADSTSRTVIGYCQDVVSNPAIKVVASNGGICIGRN